MLHRILFLAFVLVSSAAVAQTWQDTITRIEKLFSRYTADKPGASVTIARNGKVLYTKAWGMADMEHNIALTPTAPSEAGSVSKQFTAAAVLILEQDGKLSLDDDVRKYIPELPDYGSPITLRQMMTHSSGLKDWGTVAAMTGWQRGTKAYDNDDALYIMSKQKTLNHAPGDEFLYSNSNYNLFAIIVERVSGMSLYEFSKKRIFEPAGMTQTEWRANYKKIVPNRALAYSRSNGEWFTDMPNEYVYGNGGLLTTTADLVKWNEYYAANKLGAGGLLEKQIAVSSFNNGKPNEYAAGLFIQKFRDELLWTHNGATASYRANLDYFPNLGLSIAFLSNTSAFDRDSVIVPIELRRIFLPLPASADTRPSPPPVFQVSAEKLDGYAGWFRNTRTNGGLRLVSKDGKLLTGNNSPLTPVADGVFSAGNNRIVFQANNGSAFMINDENDTTLLTRESAPEINETNIHAYAGEYYSEETESKIWIAVVDGKLVLKIKPADKFPLRPTYKDGFEAPFGPIRFFRDGNKVKSFHFSTGRARNVEFVKVK